MLHQFDDALRGDQIFSIKSYEWVDSLAFLSRLSGSLHSKCSWLDSSCMGSVASLGLYTLY